MGLHSFAEPASEGKQASLQQRTFEEQILAGRHERALARFEEQQAQWEAFRSRAAKRTGRGKEELVVTRAEEHRERLEVMELLDRATPDEVKSGGHSWYHSLRGEGTRYVQIGNMFSGLHLPVKLHKEEYVHEIVRKPLLTELSASQSRRKRTWRDDEYLQARIRRYRKRMEELAPGKLGFDEMLEPEAVKAGASTSKATMVLDSICEDDPPADVVESPATSPLASPSSTAQAAAAQSGPRFDLEPDRLQFETQVGSLSTKGLQLRNTGTAAVRYEWVLKGAQRSFMESVLPDDPTRCFACNETDGTILPGEMVKTVFSFASFTPGAFTCSWRLRTYPELHVPITDVPMHGVSAGSDALQERRQNFRGTLLQQQVLHQVQELIEDVVESVELQVPPPPDMSAQAIRERVFEEANADWELYYTPHAWQRFEELGVAVDELKRARGGAVPAAPPVEPPDRDRPLRGRRPVEKARAQTGMPPTFPLDRGAHTAQQLTQKLEALPSSDERAQLELELSREVRAARRRPLERSQLWWLAHEVVTELVLALPDRWAHARKAAELQPLPFLPPPDSGASHDLVAEHEARVEARQNSLGEAEREAEVQSAFVNTFAQDDFGPAVANFAAGAREITASARMQRAAALSLYDRMQPYLELPNMDSVEMGGSVVLYEADLGFLNRGEGSKLALEGDDVEMARKRLQGVNTLLESVPRSVLVMVHVGQALPSVPRAPSPETRWPPGLPSLEPLNDLLREVCQDTASSVEFVPHAVWLDDAEAFAERVRSDAEDKKVYLLENMSAFPEELGVRRSYPSEPQAAEGEPASAGDPSDVNVELLPWAVREAWADRTFGGDLRPEFLVQDSFSAACKSLTSHVGLWLGAPQRIVGSIVEAELHAFAEALQLPWRKSTAPPRERVPAPLLIVVGGGMLEDEELLLCKLELLLGLGQLARYERGGVVLALGSELALKLLQGLYGACANALASAMRETLLELLGLGLRLLLPVELRWELPDGTDQTLPLSSLFSAAPPAVRLGYRDGVELSAELDTEGGMLTLAEGGSEAHVPMTLPEGGQVRDVGDAAVEALELMLKRARGVVWNGALGCWEDERWQKSTRAWAAALEKRLAGGDGDEEEEEEEDEEDEEEEEPRPKDEQEQEVEFEVAAVLGKGSGRRLAELMETPSLVTFVSQSGEGLLQVLRGEPLPGLLACAGKTRSQ